MKRSLKVGGILFVVILLGLAVYNLPPVRARLDWRLAEWRARIQYALSPPEEAVFVPQEQAPTGAAPPTNTPAPTTSVTPGEKTAEYTPTPAPTQLLSPSPTPLPARVSLNGVRHIYQTWNNCGPANLAMALSFWGRGDTQQAIADFTKPNPRDKNVMPYEMAAYVREKTDLEVIVRAGGDLELVKTFLAAGLPVILEKGFEGAGFDGWMGHYVTVTGYDDAEEHFTVQDSYIMPDMPVSYTQTESFWRAFNFTYLVIYPPERADGVMAILGQASDETASTQAALALASEEIYTLSGRDQFFAWFNRGTNLVALQDYAGAARAYDEAFAIYAGLPEEIRPWRMMWYQTGPYWAYFYAGRYYDVFNLTTTTLDAMSEPVLEESYYWRALAREALGDSPGALGDLRTSLEVHPGFEPSEFQLARLGQ